MNSMLWFRKRIKLRKICEACGLALYRDVRAFALLETDLPPDPHIRRNGKTTAACLRLLLTEAAVITPEDIALALTVDPDFKLGHYALRRHTVAYFYSLYHVAIASGVALPRIDLDKNETIRAVIKVGDALGC
ncbi:MAG: hypothetical protein E7434_01675 [Ruminococcaceae bacterium]|nr:hypothetical protein [Oscillospiraceae bacterium]